METHVLERRSIPRSTFRANVPCSIGDQCLELYVYDLSMDGCMIQTSSDGPMEGQTVVLNFSEECTATGVVLWRKNQNLGLKFETRLASEVVELLVKAAALSPSFPLPPGQFDRSVLKVAHRKIDPPRYGMSQGMCDTQTALGD
jgi:hypothetical protein